MAMLAHYTEGNGDIHTVEYLAPVLARLYFRRQLQGARLSSHQEVGLWKLFEKVLNFFYLKVLKLKLQKVF